MTDVTRDILFVEDSPDDVAFVQHAFKKANLEARVQLARDGAEALNLLFGEEGPTGKGPMNRPRVVFLDLKVPKVGGLQILSRLKSDPRTREIPVVVLSSSDEERDLVESYRLGANSYVVKPMEFHQFSETIQMLGVYWLELNQTPR